LTRSEPLILSRLLSPFTRVRQGEATAALLMMLNVFLLLTAYYLLKPVREGLILKVPSGAEYKAYMGGVIAILLLFVVPAYARFADAVPRLKLVVSVTLFFALHLILFYWADARFQKELGVWLALGFFAWIGIFNVMVVAQFWSFANDLYDEEQGKRLFPLIALGASAGAALGSTIAGVLIPVFGIQSMLLAGAAVLVICAGLFWAVERVERAEPSASAREPKPQHAVTERPPARLGGAFQLVLRERYLLWIALFALVFSCVNTNGEYILGKLVKAAASAAVASGEIAAGTEDDYIGATFGKFFSAVNVVGLLLQAFVVSRLVRKIGLEAALFVLPVIAFGDAMLVAIFPVLSVIRWGKIAENATDYSLNNTLRQMLWLVTTREQKYKAKQAVDTFFVRMGDVTAAVLVWVLVSQLSFSVRGFALVNAALVAAWLLVTVLIVREHRAIERRNARLQTEAHKPGEAGRSSPAS
jgi:ATP:ADP antiporter, AAA family